MTGICLKRIHIMNKREISEIKKQFKKDNNAITRICGCYVDGEKEKKTEMKDAFLSLPEEEMFKYFDIFRKSLSGTIGKNLLNMEFPLETESEGGTQEFLLKLRNSRLTDDALLEEFYNRVIDSYDYVCIAAFHVICHTNNIMQQPTIFRENQRTEVKCSMHPMKSMITSCVPSVRSSFPSQDSVITQKKTASMSVSVTGS